MRIRLFILFFICFLVLPVSSVKASEWVYDDFRVNRLAIQAELIADRDDSERVRDHLIVEKDENGDILYHNKFTGNTLNLGYGDDPIFIDDTAVQWFGEDGHVYQAEIQPHLARGSFQTHVVKTKDDPDVYVIGYIRNDNGDHVRYRQLIPDEDVYFSWYESWDMVELITPELLSTYKPYRSLSFAPGTKVKYFDRSNIFMVGSDKLRHWLSDSDVAQSVYGFDWEKTVINIQKYWKLIDYAELNPIIRFTDLYQF